MFIAGDGTWHVPDWTAMSGAPAFAAGIPVTGHVDGSGSTHIIGVGTDQHLYDIRYNNGFLPVLEVSAVYDAGTVSLTLGSFTATICYGNSTNSACSGQPVNSTAAQVAAALAQAINVPSSPATATVSGPSINLVWRAPGPFTPAITSLSTTHDSPSLFPNPSFTSPATVFGGGAAGTLSNPYVTLYQHDALGNLVNVTQKGGTTDSTQWRVRTFTYDSLSHLLTATNPESGTINYSYDVEGNLLRKTSPAPNQTGTAMQTISYCYDALNRVTGKAYSAQSCPLSSPVVTYTYDAGQNGIGHLTSLTDQAGSANYSYDALGRTTAEQRTTAGVSKSLLYSYYLNNSLSNLTYPDGSVVSYTIDSGGRILSAVDAGNNLLYVTSATYGPDNSITGFTNGHSNNFPGINNSFSYNSRLQPFTMSASAPNAIVFSIGFDFHYGTGNNGNIFRINNYRDNSRTQTFTYDALNRLTSAQNAGTDCTQKTVNNLTEYWGNSYGYDAWGNLLQKTVTKCSAENLNITAASNNQVHTISGPDYTYDSVGNTVHDATSGFNYSYDPENRITGTTGYTYTYDAGGNRVTKSNGSTGTIYWYMSPGVVAESDLTGAIKSEYIFWGGKRVARRDWPANSVFYYFSDHLKTASVITDSVGTIKEDEDFYPWGGELQFVNNDSNHYKFTSKERDTETQLDYFGARYYENWLGRFGSSDPVMVSRQRMLDPQQWNMYAYVRNNPLLFVDDDGRDLHIFVTAKPVGQSTVNRYTASEMRSNPHLRQHTETVATYRAIIVNDSGHMREVEVTRDTVRNGTASETRGKYGTNSEAPPGTYSGATRDDGAKGFRVELSDQSNAGSGTITGPDGTRTDIQMHIGPGASEGCMLLTGGSDGRDAFQNDINELRNEDRENGLGTKITVTVVDRNIQPEQAPQTPLEPVRPQPAAQEPQHDH